MQTIIYSGGATSSNLENAKKYIESVSENFENSPDYLFIDKAEDKSKIGIEEIKQAISFVFVKPSYSKFKVILINNAQYLSLESQNALLKTLEEPPNYALFVMTVDHPSNLLQTILSRSIVRQINRESTDTQSQYLEILEDYKKIHDSSIGQRIDWLIEYKTDLSDKDFTIGLCNELILFYHELLPHEKSTETLSQYKSRIQFLFQIKDNILKFNANPLLCIESYLVTN